MGLLVGTSGWSFKEWKGSFYPKGLPDDGMLSYYAGKFPTVEINNTFYRMPKESVLLDWASKVPPAFRFAIKASQRITHHGRLKEVDSEVEYFTRVTSVLGERRGPTLFQLPPNLKKDLPRLLDFLSLVPQTWRAALEFRHPSWFDEDVFDALRHHNAALVLAEFDPEESDLAVPAVATADFGYLRLRRAGYDEAALRQWAERVRAQPWKDAFVFFKHEDAGTGPRLAQEFKAIVGASR